MFRLIRKDKTDEYRIGKSRLSISRLNDKLVLNLWVHSEYDYMFEGRLNTSRGPMIEIFMPIDNFPAANETVTLSIPETSEMIALLDTYFMTGFYEYNHQNLTETTLVLKMISEKECEVFFKGKPSQDFKDLALEGEHILLIEDSLKRYW